LSLNSVSSWYIVVTGQDSPVAETMPPVIDAIPWLLVRNRVQADALRGRSVLINCRVRGDACCAYQAAGTFCPQPAIQLF